MSRAANWGVFLLVVSVFAFAAGPTALGGPASYVIVDGTSMEPTYIDGDLVVAYRSQAYETGDIIVYDAPVDAQFNVIHRIIERTDGGFITQGDNRDEPDGWIAPDDEIYGKALFHIPRGGAIVAFLRQPAAILAFLAGWLTLAIFDRRRPSDDQDWNRADDVDQPTGDADDVEAQASPSTPLLVGATTSSSSEPKPVEKAREPVSKRTVAIFGIAALLGGSAGVMVANAASLRVDGGVLQAFSITDLPEPPAPPSEAATVTLQVHFFSSGQGAQPGTELGEGVSPTIFDPIDVPAGHSYDIAWNGPGNSTVVDCSDESITFRDGPPSGSTPQGDTGPFGPMSESETITHLLCIQTAPGNISQNLTFTVMDGEGASTQVALTQSSVADGSCDESDEDGCAEHDAESDQGSSDPDGASEDESSNETDGSTPRPEPSGPDATGDDEGEHADGDDDPDRDSASDDREHTDEGAANEDPEGGTPSGSSPEGQTPDLVVPDDGADVDDSDTSDQDEQDSSGTDEQGGDA